MQNAKQKGATHKQRERKQSEWKCVGMWVVGKVKSRWRKERLPCPQERACGGCESNFDSPISRPIRNRYDYLAPKRRLPKTKFPSTSSTPLEAQRSLIAAGELPGDAANVFPTRAKTVAIATSLIVENPCSSGEEQTRGAKIALSGCDQDHPGPKHVA